MSSLDLPWCRLRLCPVWHILNGLTLKLNFSFLSESKYSSVFSDLRKMEQVVVFPRVLQVSLEFEVFIFVVGEVEGRKLNTGECELTSGGGCVTPMF